MNIEQSRPTSRAKSSSFVHAHRADHLGIFDFPMGMDDKDAAARFAAIGAMANSVSIRFRSNRISHRAAQTTARSNDHRTLGDARPPYSKVYASFGLCAANDSVVSQKPLTRSTRGFATRAISRGLNVGIGVQSLLSPHSRLG